MTAKACKKLAGQIVGLLFINGDGEQAARLELKDEQDRGMGGWCRQAVADHIEELLVVQAERAKKGRTRRK